MQDTLARLRLDPKKSLGQNFMVEEAILERIAEAAEIGPQDAVLEIGAGLGALTGVLAGRARRVVAVEIDGRLIPELTRRFADEPRVEIVEADILKADIAALMAADATEYKVAANPPYYITSAIIRCLLESSAPPSLIVMTVQYEVGQRLAARPGDLSLLAVGVQFYGSPQIVAKLSPGVFYPRPSVESALVRIAPHPAGPPLPADQRRPFFQIVRAGFSQPRKQLRNSLAAGLHLDTAVVVHWMTQAGLDPTRRAETLAVGDWLALYHGAGDLLR
jgi:16S rRNA (adenine1518-N6/adenine1519-N6)-dimethyltransferase